MRRTRVHLFGIATLLMAAGLVGSGCGLLELLFGNAGTGFPIPSDSVLLVLRNESGLPALVDANFVFSVQDVRRTTRRLEVSGVESVETILRTAAQRIEVVARVAAELEAKSPFEEPGFVLLERNLVLGTDYEGGDTLEIIIPAPGNDCNENGLVDEAEIADGTATDCNENAVPDECEADADEDGIIDACDNCPDLFNPEQGVNDCQAIAPTGACCMHDGSCELLTEAACGDAEGAYAGDDVTCVAAECPQPAGACCFSDGSCSVLTETGCSSEEGSYQGHDTSCTQVACSQPAATGACCLPDDVCAVLTSDECTAGDGVYQGDELTCDEVECTPSGACCLFDGPCVDVTANECFFLEGQYQGDFSTCSETSCPQPAGACCLEDGGCMDVTAAECESLEGSFEGNFSLCELAECPQPLGACCFGVECVELTSDECNASKGGSYQGDGTSCESGICSPPTGACCLGVSGCVDISELECSIAEGEYHGDGTTCDNDPCPPLVACCISIEGQDFCVDMTEDGCQKLGGSSLGAGSVCEQGSCDTQITASMTASRDWFYERLEVDLDDPGLAEPRSGQCQIFFTASIEGDPRENSTYSFFWFVEAPLDQPGGTFEPAFGLDSEIESFYAPVRPAYSPSNTPYLVTVMIVGDQFGNVGTASVPIEVRLHGDVNNDGCTDEADVQLIIGAEDSPPADPEQYYTFDVTCDFDITGLDAQSAEFVASDVDGYGNCKNTDK